jgi:hypothetical protein
LEFGNVDNEGWGDPVDDCVLRGVSLDTFVLVWTLVGVDGVGSCIKIVLQSDLYWELRDIEAVDTGRRVGGRVPRGLVAASNDAGHRHGILVAIETSIHHFRYGELVVAPSPGIEGVGIVVFQSPS